MSVVKIRSEEDVHAVVAQTLGFHPNDSLVVLGIHGVPTARLDLVPFGEATEALAPMLAHWAGGTVLVVGYGDAQPMAEPVADWLERSGVEVVLSIEAGNRSGPVSSGSLLDAKRVVSSRAELEAEARLIDDAQEAEDLAVAAYLEGRGAQAWIFHDQAVRLNGGSSPAMVVLADLLNRGVDPRQGS